MSSKHILLNRVADKFAAITARFEQKTQSSDLEHDRQELELMESKLIHNLLCSDTLPEDLDEEKAKEAAVSLFDKRKRWVKRNCLALAGQFMNMFDFENEFSNYAAQYPGTHKDGFSADAKQFLKYVLLRKIFRKSRSSLNLAKF